MMGEKIVRRGALVAIHLENDAVYTDRGYPLRRVSICQCYFGSPPAGA